VYRSFLSWRYLVKRPTNLIGIVGILVGVGALILILSIMTGFLEESRRTVRGTLSDLIIKPIQGEHPGHQSVPKDPRPLLTALAEDRRIEAAAPQLVWYGIVMLHDRGRFYERLLADQTHSGLLGVQLVGVDVDGAQRLGLPLIRAAMRLSGAMPVPVRPFHDELEATDFLHSLVGGGERHWTAAPVDPLFPFKPPPRRAPGREKAGILVGEQLYSQLDLSDGDVIELGTIVIDPPTGDSRQNNREFVVAGTFRTRDNETDLGRVYMDRRELTDFLGGTNEYTQVLVRLVDYPRDAREVTADLRDGLARRGLIAGGELYADGQLEVRTWEEFRGNLLGAIENERVLMGIMLSLVLVVAGFTIFAILSMMVTEKRRDIGVLAALGAPPRGILALFLMVAFWDAVLGSLIGAGLGTWGAIEIDSIERWLSRNLDIQIFNRDVYLFDHIPSVVEPVWVASIVLGAFVCALYFAARPAVRAARLDPLEALRYE